MEKSSLVRLSLDEVQSILDSSIPGEHTSFLRASHSLWTRFKNYDKHKPFGLSINDEIKSIIYSTFNRDGYANLYEIVTLEGQQGHGYGHVIWSSWIKHATESGCTRLKLSCTPKSIKWHNSHGLLFWGVDKSGSLRSDQVLYPTVEEQLQYRQEVIQNPSQYLPPDSQVKKFKKEISQMTLSASKQDKVKQAIQEIGKSWMAEYLFKENNV